MATFSQCNQPRRKNSRAQKVTSGKSNTYFNSKSIIYKSQYKRSKGFHLEKNHSRNTQRKTTMFITERKESISTNKGKQKDKKNRRETANGSKDKPKFGPRKSLKRLPRKIHTKDIMHLTTKVTSTIKVTTYRQLITTRTSANIVSLGSQMLPIKRARMVLTRKRLFLSSAILMDSQGLTRI